MDKLSKMTFDGTRPMHSKPKTTKECFENYESAWIACGKALEEFLKNAKENYHADVYKSALSEDDISEIEKVIAWTKGDLYHDHGYRPDDENVKIPAPVITNVYWRSSCGNGAEVEFKYNGEIHRVAFLAGMHPWFKYHSDKDVFHGGFSIAILYELQRQFLEKETGENTLLWCRDCNLYEDLDKAQEEHEAKNTV